MSSSCPSCSVKFSLFKRKRNCLHCRGHFCSDCLVKDGKGRWCHTCRILVRSPHDKQALLKLSIKDLRAYLQRKHISTVGCSEKQDLVDLIYENFGHSSLRRGEETAPRNDSLSGHSSSHVSAEDDPDEDSEESAASQHRPAPPPPPPVVDDGIRVRAYNEDEVIPEENACSPPRAEPAETGAGGNGDGNVDVEMDGEADSTAAGTEDQREEQSDVAEQSEHHDESEDETMHVDPPHEMSEDRSLIPSVRRLGRFPSVSDLERLEDVEALSVRECKELLALYRVDYKGMCEKFELLAKVRELWLERRKAKEEAERLPDDELCRICMDSKIDCVLLECGHMVTCTLCGKKMNECPICRQYVIRAVHVFRT